MQLSLWLAADLALVVLQVVDEIESSTGAPLDPSNQDGWSQLQTRVEVRIWTLLGFLSLSSAPWALDPVLEDAREGLSP